MDARKEKFEKDPEGLNVGINIKKLVKIYHGETGMYACVYVCVCMCVYIYMYVCMYVCV